MERYLCMPPVTITLLFIFSFFSAPIFGQKKSVENNLTLSTSLRYQLDYKMKIKKYPTYDLSENFHAHLVPAIEVGYQKKKFVSQLSLGFYGGEDTLTRYLSTGHPDVHFPYPTPYEYTIDSWSYVTKYTYLSTRLSVGRRFFSESPFNLDLGGYISIDTRINLEGRNHVHIAKYGMTPGVGPFSGYPGYDTETVSYDEFELDRFSKFFTHFGFRIAPQFIIKDRIMLGLESNIKFQLGNGRRQKAYEPLTYHDLLAFDYAIRVGFIIRSRKSIEER
jgi:hypothetical protein